MLACCLSRWIQPSSHTQFGRSPPPPHTHTHTHTPEHHSRVEAPQAKPEGPGGGGSSTPHRLRKAVTAGLRSATVPPAPATQHLKFGTCSRQQQGNRVPVMQLLQLQPVLLSQHVSPNCREQFAGSKGGRVWCKPLGRTNRQVMMHLCDARTCNAQVSTRHAPLSHPKVHKL